MAAITLELDNFINPTIGAEVSFHAISWNAGRRPTSIPSGGNLHYHSLPAAGTVEHSHEFGEVVLILSGAITHCVNGEKQLLEANSIVFVRPDDRHAFQPAPGAPNCELMLLSYHLEFFITISRYLENDEFLHGYTEGVLPSVFRIPESRMNELSLELLNLNESSLAPAVRKIRFKVLLVELFTRCFLPEAAGRPSGAPEWLEQLCEKCAPRPTSSPDSAACSSSPDTRRSISAKCSANTSTAPRPHSSTKCGSTTRPASSPIPTRGSRRSHTNSTSRA